MRLAKRMMAVALSAAMLVSGLYVGNTASAQVSYDPTNEERGYHGIYIDTDSVPNDENIEVTKDGSQTLIKSKTNVCFQLDCNVDSSWEVKADDATSVGVDDVVVSQKGRVSIKPDAKAGFYTITAKPQNVTTVKNSTVRLQVLGTEDPAKVKKVLLNKELMDSDQMTVSDDRKTLTVDGTVTNEPLYVTVEPDYLYEVVEEGAIAFGKSNWNKEVYDLPTADRITTKQKSTGVTLQCSIGTKAEHREDFTLIVNEQDFTKKLVCEEKITPGSNNTYDISMDREVHYDVMTNAASSLPQHAIKTMNWTLSQNEEALTPEAETVTMDGIAYQDYKIMGSDGDEKICVAHVYLSNSVKAIDKNASVIVKTETFTSQQLAKGYKVNMLELTGAGTTEDDNDVNIEITRFRISTTMNSNFSDIRLDFAQAGLIEDVDYAVKKETFGEQEKDVYYFEADEQNLDLTQATFVDVEGVASFEAARDKAFTGNAVSYTVQYIFEDFEAFGSPNANAKYNNTDFKEGEFGNQSQLSNNTKLTKTGIGYKKLTVKCTSGTADAKTAEYIIRFVSPAQTLFEDGLTISQNSSRNYDLEQETVHIRQGEAVVPKINDKEVTLLDPYMDYEFSVENVANRIISKNDDYRINGLKAGKVRVTAIGTVNKTYQDSFDLYVNKDSYDGDFEILFTDAQRAGQVQNSSEVLGKWDKVPVNVRSTSVNGGIPVVTWSVNCDESYATIDAETGDLTTKRTTSNGKPITITATSVSDQSKKVTFDFTIVKVSATSIKLLAEDVAEGETAVVTPNGDNTGICQAGDRFKLYASSYEPKNATDLDGQIQWSTNDDTVATVDEDGVVTAVGKGTTQISAVYTYEGSQKPAVDYTIQVEDATVAVEEIVASDLELNYVGDSKNIGASVLPENASDKTLSYKSSDEKIATIDEKGQVTAINAGKCTITITAANGVKKEITVTVKGESKDPITSGNPNTPTVNPPVVSQLPQQTPAPVSDIPAKNTKVSSAGSDFVVTSASASGGEVAMSKAKNAKSVNVPDTVTVSGKKYKVTSIKANAFKNNKKLTSVTIGKNVKSIGKNAFNGCKKLKKVTVKSTVLKSIGAKAFAKGSKKITVTVPKKKAKAYKKMFKKSGISKKAKYKNK